MGRAKLPWAVVTLVGIAVLLCCCSTSSPPSTSSPDEFAEYFGMAPPGLTPELFAPGMLPPEGGVAHSFPAFSQDGSEAYFSTYFPDQEPRVDVIMFLEWQGGEWGSAQVAPFSGEFNDNWPWFAQDGNRLYFSSQRPGKGGGDAEEYGLWYVDRAESGWSAPRQIATPADFDRDEGPIYVAAVFPGGFGDMDIYGLEYVDGAYRMPENLGPTVNTDAEEYGPCVAQDGSYLVFTRYEEAGERSVDLYVSFRQEDGTWTEAQNMGESIEAFRGGRFPGLSPEGSYLFFVAEGGEAIYWVDTEVVDLFRPEE
jgi:hypothetical protein